MDRFEREGFYGEYGGAFIPEVLRTTFEELNEAYYEIRKDPGFWNEYLELTREYCGRPTPLTHAKNLTAHFGGAKIFFKREDLNHTGAHKANNVMGQGLLMKRMGKTRAIAETGAGQHGIATATMSAKFGFECVVYMGAHDVHRQRPNVFWMEKLGAKVVPVESGTKILKDAINETFRDWVTNMENTHYVLGTSCGPHPFPSMVSWFQSIIGMEARKQILEADGKLPSRIFACVGGGSNSLGVFLPFLEDESVEAVGVEAGGEGLGTGRHAIRILSEEGQKGIAQGYCTKFIQDRDGQMKETHSVSAGLDYVGISPIHAFLADENKIRFEYATDAQAIDALKITASKEGLIAALESSHAIARGLEEASRMSPEESVIICLSGRGDKDIFTIAEALKDENWIDFLKTRIH